MEKQETKINQDMMILAKDCYYSLDTHQTKLNNNVLVVGTSGSGKTRSVVTPNILQASGSYVISDPKGNLYQKYKGFLKENGYIVKKIDFTDPKNSSHYNFFEYIHSPMDIVKIANSFVNQKKGDRHMDPFWDQAAQLLIQAFIAYIYELVPKKEQNLEGVIKMLMECKPRDSNSMIRLFQLFQCCYLNNPDSFAYNCFTQVSSATEKTMCSILITVFALFAPFGTPEIFKMTAKDDIKMETIGQRKTALFIVVSDTDRSMDGLVNIFLTQLMNTLCEYADKKCKNNCLPVPVRFILDDFATNCKIEEFPRIISSIRSRGISTMLMIQSEGQLREYYGDDSHTIISNCDTYVYLGGNDVATARAVSERCDQPLKKILNMPVGTNWIFRRGQAPINGTNFEIDDFIREKMVEYELGG